MKQIYYIVAAAAALTALLAGCKTTEENYRAAYERAVAGRDSAEPDDDGFAAVDASQHIILRDMVVGADTVKVATAFVRGMAPTEVKTDSVPAFDRFLLVVGDFTQVFNARSMRARLDEAGYHNAVVVNASDGRFYVAADTYPTLVAANMALKAVKREKHFPVALKSPAPFILESARHRR